MTHKIVESSPKALALVTTTTDVFGLNAGSQHHRTKYPFDSLAIGQSFTLPIEGTNEISLRNQAVAWKKRTGGKIFTVIKHREYACFEVARIY